MSAVVTRFAPSPTGLLHIGGVRTALFSWLYARRMKGQFILRIEDTDLERSTPEAVKVILEGMAWLGLEHDQGPFYQTQRFDRYKEVIADMVKAGTAYHCYCSKEELDAMRAAQQLAQGKAALRRPLPARQGSGRGQRPSAGGAFRESRRGRDRGRRRGARPGHVPEQGARRSDHRALRRHAHLQLLRGGGRRRHGRHARDPRRRSPEQHAAADEHAAGARQDAAGVRARAHDPGAGRHQALQAPRRGQRAASTRTRAIYPRRCSTISCGSAGRMATRNTSRATR